MRLIPVIALVKKDLLIFFGDRRSVIVAFVVPIAIASFFGSLFGGRGNSEPAKIDVAMVDHDNSAISRGIVAGARGDRNLKLSLPSEAAVRESVKRGKTSVAVIIPKGFGAAAGQAFLGLAPQPALRVMYDPSHRTELAMVSGILTQHVMQAVSREVLGGPTGRALVNQSVPRLESLSMNPAQRAAMLQMLTSIQTFYARDSSATADSSRGGLSMPYTISEEPVTSGPAVNYNGYAHSFGGMGIQFLLFAMANLGIEMLLERQRGLWKRLRSAPVSRFMLLGAKVLSGALISLMTLWISFAFAMIVFGVRIQGSVMGFVGVSIACALMAATFGLLVAALGRTPATARGVTTLAVLMLVMLGGAWVPAFIFPAWLQQVTKATPVRWAVDGLDAMTWRGLGFDAALGPILVLLAFAVGFGAIAAARFRWEES